MCAPARAVPRPSPRGTARCHVCPRLHLSVAHTPRSPSCPCLYCVLMPDAKASLDAFVRMLVLVLVLALVRHRPLPGPAFPSPRFPKRDICASSTQRMLCLYLIPLNLDSPSANSQPPDISAIHFSISVRMCLSVSVSGPNHV